MKLLRHYVDFYSVIALKILDLEIVNETSWLITL